MKLMKNKKKKMNTNQVNQAFEAFVKNEYDQNANLKTEKYNHIVYKDDEIDSLWLAWKAATQASESEINSLKERVEELEADIERANQNLNAIENVATQLQADNLRLREALTQLTALKFSTASHIQKLDAVAKIANKALSSTPAQSLAEHDNEIIHHCADTALYWLDDDDEDKNELIRNIVKSINKLKATPTQSLAEKKEVYEAKLMAECTDPNA